MGFAQGFSAGANARQSRDELRMKQQARNEELTRMGYSFDGEGGMAVRADSLAEQEQLQAKENTQLLKAVQGKLTAQDTDNAFEDFAHTGDASYLQKVLDTNPQAKKAWGERGVHMVGNIDFSNDSQVLARAGMEPSMYDTPEKQAILKKNVYKYYDGKDWNVGLLSQAAAETGAITRMGERRGGVILDNQAQLRSLLEGPKTHAYTAEGHKYEKEINAAAEETGVPANVIAAMMKQESSNNPNAVSPKGAEGLMQLMPDTAKELGVTDPRDPMQNVMAGARYLKQNLDKYGGDLKMALAAYNAGPGNVDKYNGIPPFAETQNYVSKIMGNLDEAEAYYNSSADGMTQQIRDRYQKQEDIILDAQRARAQAAGGVDPNIEKRKLDIAELDAQAKLATAGASKPSNKEKEFDAAARTQSELFDSFGGEDAFYKTDFNDIKNYRKAVDSVTKIEELTNTKPSEADKKAITDMRKLIALGATAINISDDKTGLLDTRLSNVKQYLDDNTSGIASRSAYAAFSNTLLHAMAGSAMTDGEIARFENAFGSLGQKRGPVLEHFKTALLQVRAELESNARNMNPVSAQVRLGADTQRLSTILDNLDKTVKHINGMSGIQIGQAGAYPAARDGAQPQVASRDFDPPATAEDTTAKLDAIFKQTPKAGQ